MGAAGPAILFVILLAASIMVGVCVLAYAARCVLVIVQETGLGQDEIVWPNEPMQDWLGHAVQFVELLGIWLAPSALAARLLRHVWLPEDGALRVLLLAGPGLWLFFPIGLLSSLSAESRWVPFRWAIFARFLRVAPAAMIFYFVTALLLSGAVVPWYYALFADKAALLPVAAAVGAAVLFLYARLLGRLAWIIQRLPATERPPAQRRTKKRPSAIKPGPRKKRKPKADVRDPWVVPQEEASHAEEIEVYGFAADKPAEAQTPPPKPPRSRFAMSPEEYEPIEVQSPPEAAAQPPRQPQSDLFAEQVRQRIAERTRVQSSPPAHPFLSGVYSFPLYSACVPNGLALALGLLAVGGLVRQMMQFGQMLFGW